MNSIPKEIFNIQAYHGNETLKWIDTVAELRISEFQNFPYLYSGNLNIEKKYLTSYTQDTQSVIIIASWKDEIAGILTGMPLTSHLEPVPGAKEIFIKNGLHPQEYYYCGEFIVKTEFRNQGIAKALYENLIDHVKNYGFNKLCLMTVDRVEKPPSYFDTEFLWKKLGFVKTIMKITINWPTIHNDKSVSDKEHTLTFWINDQIK